MSREVACEKTITVKNDVTGLSNDYDIRVETTETESETCDEKQCIGQQNVQIKILARQSDSVHGYIYDGTVTRNCVKRLQYGLKNELSVACSCSYDSENDCLKLVITHPCMDASDEYVLKKYSKQQSSLTREKNTDNKSKSFVGDSNEEKEYLITTDMIGQRFRPTFRMSHSEVKTELDRIYKCEYGTSYRWNLPHLNNYYTIKYVWQKTRPTYDSNTQLVYPGLLVLPNGNGGNTYFVKCDNGYTILTQIYKNEVIGVLTKSRGKISIKFIHYFADGNKITYPCFEKHDMMTKGGGLLEEAHYYCSEENYYKYFDFMTFPIDIPNAIHRVGESSFFVIKDRKFYGDPELITNGVYDISLTHYSVYNRMRPSYNDLGYIKSFTLLNGNEVVTYNKFEFVL